MLQILQIYLLFELPVPPEIDQEGGLQIIEKMVKMHRVCSEEVIDLRMGARLLIIVSFPSYKIDG